MSTAKHPQLAKKLSRLYSSCLNPSVDSNAALAKHLGISRQAISKWVHGSDTNRGNCIPQSQIREVAAAFGMEPFWFSLELNEFGEKLKDRLDPADSPAAAAKISLASLPTTGLELFGREDELDALDSAWLAQETNCLEIVAFGGVGKSSLVNNWLSRLAKQAYAGARRVYGWSFAWQGTGSDVISSGDLFIEQALEWFGDEHPDKGTPWAKANRLASLIRESRTLLILDGLEPLQHPPGPKQGEIEAPAVSLLLRELAANNNGLCLITSRIAIAEFAAYDDGRIKTLYLDRLSNADAVQYLQAMHIHGNQETMHAAVEAYSGHPLCLSLLAGYLTVVHEGDVSHFRELDSLAQVQSFEVHAGNIVRAYLRWIDSSAEISLLNLLGLFDRGIALDEVRSLVDTEAVPELTLELAQLSELEWSYALKKLEDAKLVLRYKRDGRSMIDCHPLVRDFLNAHLKNEQAETWRKGNALIFNFLQDSARISPSTMLELEPLFRAVIHGTRAGLFEESFQLYFERIKRRQFSMFTEGSHHADQSCIRAFFRKPWTEPVAQLSEEASSYLLSSAATNLIYLGQIGAAIPPSAKSIQWFRKNARWVEAAATSGPLISMLIAAGRLSDAREEWNRAQRSVTNADNEVLAAVATSIGAYLSFLEGDIEAAERLFCEAELVLCEEEAPCEIVCPTISAYYCKYLLDTGETEKALERALLTMRWREHRSWQVAVDTTSLFGSDLLFLGLTYLKLGDMENAAEYLNKQVAIFKAANEWLYLPSGLIARAQLFLAQGEASSAQQDLSEALDIAQTTGARYSEWEANIALAASSLQRGEFEAGQHYFRQAAQIEGMNSYRHCEATQDALEVQLFSGEGSGRARPR